MKLNFNEDKGLFGQTHSAYTVFPVRYFISAKGNQFIAQCWGDGPRESSGLRNDFAEVIEWAEDHFEDMVKKFWPMAVEQ